MLMDPSKSNAISLLFPESTEIPDLGPGPRNGTLSIAAVEHLLAELPKEDGRSTQLVRALVLVWHDHHDPAHVIVQDMPSQDAAYVHAILHRREPDFGNARYWFRRLNNHPAFSQLAARADAVIRNSSGDLNLGELQPNTGWDALAFVDACEHPGAKSGVRHATLRTIQQAEFEILLTHLLQNPK